MAKEQMSIVRSVRIGGLVYVPGMEDDLKKIATPEQLERLSEKGAITGDISKPKAPAKEAENEQTDGGDKTTGGSAGKGKGSKEAETK